MLKKTKAAYQQYLQDKRQQMLKTILKPAKLTPYQLRSLNLLRIHGHPVHLQEGSICFCLQSVHLTAHSKVSTSLAHICKPKSSVATSSDSHLEYVYYFPEYAKYFGKPALLNKEIYGLVYSGKYWNFEFSEWLYLQSLHPVPISTFLLCLLQQTQPMVTPYAIKTEFKESVCNRFDVKFLGPAQWNLHMHKPTLLINIATFSTPYNITILIPDSLNVKHHSHPVKTTDQ